MISDYRHSVLSSFVRKSALVLFNSFEYRLLLLHRGTWLARSVGHAALDLGVVGSSPMLDVVITYKMKSLQKVIFILKVKK